ncbi:MAG: hypothetical protein IPK60_02640 [Sandaracinaceae bacterium]|nr:hypothetical protein [Sandaracinaceae bacterium]
MTDPNIRGIAGTNTVSAAACGSAEALADELHFPEIAQRLRGTSDFHSQASVMSDVFSRDMHHTLDVLACVRPEDVVDALRSVFGDNADRMEEAVRGIAQRAVRTEIQQEASARLREMSQQLAQLSQEPALSSVVRDFRSGVPAALELVAMASEISGDATEVSRLANRNAHASEQEVRSLLAHSFRSAHEAVRELETDVNRNRYISDEDGDLFVTFPGLVSAVAREHGVPHADALRAHHDASALGSYIADDLTESNSNRQLSQWGERIWDLTMSLSTIALGGPAIGYFLNTGRAFTLTRGQIQEQRHHARDLAVAVGIHANARENAAEASRRATVTEVAAATRVVVDTATFGVSSPTTSLLHAVTPSHLLRDGLEHIGIEVSVEHAVPFAERLLSE